jgi:hypothetical protein
LFFSRTTACETGLVLRSIGTSARDPQWKPARAAVLRDPHDAPCTRLPRGVSGHVSHPAAGGPSYPRRTTLAVAPIPPLRFYDPTYQPAPRLGRGCPMHGRHPSGGHSSVDYCPPHRKWKQTVQPHPEVASIIYPATSQQGSGRGGNLSCPSEGMARPRIAILPQHPLHRPAALQTERTAARKAR